MSENRHKHTSRTPNSVPVASDIRFFQSVEVQDCGNGGMEGGKERGSHRFGEVAGGTTAECAAVICCPCALLNLAFLAFVRLPVGLLKKAYKRAKRKRNKAVQMKVVHYEDSDTEDSSSLESSQHEFLSQMYKLNAVVVDRPYVSTEKFWEDVVGKSYVGFWRNLSSRSRSIDSGSEANLRE